MLCTGPYTGILVGISLIWDSRWGITLHENISFHCEPVPEHSLEGTLVISLPFSWFTHALSVQWFLWIQSSSKQTTYHSSTLGIEHKVLKIAACCGPTTVAVALVSNQDTVPTVPIPNAVHFRCNALYINFDTAKVSFCFLKYEVTWQLLFVLCSIIWPKFHKFHFFQYVHSVTTIGYFQWGLTPCF